MFIKMIEIIRGNILRANTAATAAICRQVNCQSLMRSGVAINRICASKTVAFPIWATVENVIVHRPE